MELKRVVVTGLGALTPLGNNVSEFWENLVNGVSGAGPITLFDASKHKTQFACEVKNFDATKYIDRKEARKMDRYTQLAMAVAKEAVEDSGINAEDEDKTRIGVIFGAGIGGLKTFEEEIGGYYQNEDGLVVVVYRLNIMQAHYHRDVLFLNILYSTYHVQNG